MTEKDSVDSLKNKLARALKSKAILAERSKLLQQQVDDFREQEESMRHLASELVERQRELNFMLHRANSILHQLQDTNLALSAEFTHIVKELPAPTDPDWEATVTRVNELFRKTHELAGEMQDEIFRKAEPSDPPRPKTPEAKDPAASEEPTAPEPQTVESAADTAPQAEVVAEPEGILDAEIEAADEPPAEGVEDTPKQEAPTPAEDQKLSIDDIFQNLECDEHGMMVKQPADKSQGREHKQGFFSRLFGSGGKDG